MDTITQTYKQTTIDFELTDEEYQKLMQLTSILREVIEICKFYYTNEELDIMQVYDIDKGENLIEYCQIAFIVKILEKMVYFGNEFQYISIVD